MSIYYNTDTDLLEEAIDKVRGILSHMEETFGTLQQMYSQMMAQTGMEVFPQWNDAMDVCGDMVKDTRQLTDRMERMLRVLENVPEGYLQLEREHRDAISRMDMRLSSVKAGFDVVMDPAYPLGLREGVERSDAFRMEKKLADVSPEAELSEIAEISEILNSVFHFENVEIMS